MPDLSTATLLLALAEMTRDGTVLDRRRGRVHGPTPEVAAFSGQEQRDIPSSIAEALAARRAGAPYAFNDHPMKG